MSPPAPTPTVLGDILEEELVVVAGGFDGLSPDEWHTPTTLRPPVAGTPPWTLVELAGHLDISIGITLMLIDEAVAGDPPPERDAVGFFVFPSPDVASEFYEYACPSSPDLAHWFGRRRQPASAAWWSSVRRMMRQAM
jgi:hypothetical protein